MTDAVSLGLGIGLLCVLAVLAYKFGAVDIGGLVAGLGVGFVTLLAGGIGWFTVIIAFFVSSTVLTRYKYEKKRDLGFAQEKGGVRSWPNIMANGGLAAAAAGAELVFHGDVFAALFAGALATATADTLATEVGLTSNEKPRLITRLTTLVNPGISGGITLLGEATAIIVSLLVALLALGAQVGSTMAFVRSVFIAGIIGVTTDSLLGATLQGKNRCKVCDRDTESLEHHGVKTERKSGYRAIDNNVVNFLATLVGGLSCVALFLL